MAIPAVKTKKNPVTPGSIQLYIDSLKAKKETIKFELDQVIASFEQSDQIYQSAKTNKDLIEAFWNRIQTTGENAYDLICELDVAIGIIEKVGTNTHLSLQGIQVLGRTMRELSKCWETLWDMVCDLLLRINTALSGDDIDETKSIMKCLKDLSAKLEEAFPKIEAAIRATLVALKCAFLLDCSVHIQESTSSTSASAKRLVNPKADIGPSISIAPEDPALRGLLEKAQMMKEGLQKAGFIIGFDKSSTQSKDPSEVVLESDPYYIKIKEIFTSVKDKYDDASNTRTEQLNAKINKQAEYDSVCTALDAAIEAKNC